ncbi:TIP41-domain-containing protein [Meredithblackwellia eburnea MCA 4105]
MTTPTPGFNARNGELFEEGSTKGITIQNWRVSSTKLPILNAAECDAASASLHLPLPEICFGNNLLRLENLETGLALEWNALPALHAVAKESDVKVAHAAAWARGQSASSTSDLSVQKPYDWTYTTQHRGTISLPSPSSSNQSQPSTSPPSFEAAPSTHPGIPLHLLARQDIPILFFDEVPLFEDELGDNGIAELVVRVRVNTTSVFVLSRFFLRVDRVLFRIFDVRLYHAFESSEIIRETKARQASYDDVKRRLPPDRPDDLKPLTDINWVASVVEALSHSPLPPTSSSSLRSTTVPVTEMGRLEIDGGVGLGAAGAGAIPEWQAEGRTLEVLKLD